MKNLAKLSLILLVCMSVACDGSRPPDVNDGDIVILESRTAGISAAILVVRQTREPEMIQYRAVPINLNWPGDAEHLMATLANAELKRTDGYITINGMTTFWSINKKAAALSMVPTSLRGWVRRI